MVAVTIGLCCMLQLMPGLTQRADARQISTYALAVACYNRGVQLFSEQRNNEAITEFQRAIAYGGVAQAHAPLGQLLFLEGRLSEAAQELRLATQIEPNNPALWCQLGITASRLGMPELATQAFRRYLQLEPNGSYSNEARRSIEIIGSDSGSANYLCEFKHGAHRWNRPVVGVFVADAGVTGNAVDACIGQWNSIANGRIQLRRVAEPADAQIVIASTNDTAQLDSADELGMTALRLNSSGMLEAAKITLLSADALARKAGGRVPPTEVQIRAYAVMLHEFGHALGLQHSSSPADVMSATVAPLGFESAPSPRDVNTLLALYGR